MPKFKIIIPIMLKINIVIIIVIGMTGCTENTGEEKTEINSKIHEFDYVSYLNRDLDKIADLSYFPCFDRAQICVVNNYVYLPVIGGDVVCYTDEHSERNIIFKGDGDCNGSLLTTDGSDIYIYYKNNIFMYSPISKSLTQIIDKKKLTLMAKTAEDDCFAKSIEYYNGKIYISTNNHFNIMEYDITDNLLYIYEVHAMDCCITNNSLYYLCSDGTKINSINLNNREIKTLVKFKEKRGGGLLSINDDLYYVITELDKPVELYRYEQAKSDVLIYVFDKNGLQPLASKCVDGHVLIEYPNHYISDYDIERNSLRHTITPDNYGGTEFIFGEYLFYSKGDECLAKIKL